MKKTIILMMAMLWVLLVGCDSNQSVEREVPKEEVPVLDVQETKTEAVDSGEAVKTQDVSRNADWCVYWDPSPADSADKCSKYSDLVLFGCIYSEDYSLYIPDKLYELALKFSNKNVSSGQETYLSFINDVMHADGTSTQKSTDFLKAVLSDPALSDRVIDDMIKKAQTFGVNGIELDYENVHKCDGFWAEYLDFVEKLYSRASAAGLKLRVVLMVATPVSDLNFIKGPQYVVMCYNLYGNHSGPGPKADEEFLKKTYDKFKSIDAGYALANGGFEWGPNDKAVRSLTAADAAALAKEKGAEVTRDGSGALTYSFQSDDGKHTVFYGDEQTIDRWSSILKNTANGNVGISLWKLE